MPSSAAVGLAVRRINRRFREPPYRKMERIASRTAFQCDICPIAAGIRCDGGGECAGALHQVEPDSGLHLPLGNDGGSTGVHDGRRRLSAAADGLRSLRRAHRRGPCGGGIFPEDRDLWLLGKRQSAQAGGRESGLHFRVCWIRGERRQLRGRARGEMTVLSVGSRDIGDHLAQQGITRCFEGGSIQRVHRRRWWIAGLQFVVATGGAGSLLDQRCRVSCRRAGNRIPVCRAAQMCRLR